jgi:hypothetical protein
MSSTGETATAEPNTTTGMNSNPSYEAAHAVLFTNELLCDIVARLPLQDVVATTGVCRFWRDALRPNPQVREALFLTPIEVREVMVSDFDICNNTDPIPIDACFLIGAMHPSLRRICGTFHCGEDVKAVMRPGIFPNFEHPDGIWREMLISQPPCKTVLVTVTTVNPGDGDIRELELHLRNDTGVKMGKLYDLIRSKLSGDVQGSKFRVYFVTEDNMDFFETWAIKCQVRDGEVRRPAKLPIRDDLGASELAYYDSDSDHSDSYYSYGGEFYHSLYSRNFGYDEEADDEVDDAQLAQDFDNEYNEYYKPYDAEDDL